MAPHATDLFEGQRPFLTGLAYRILGSRAEAEDAVQDTWLKWREADLSEISNPAGWLTTACTRHCIDVLRSARRQRVNYVGAWLPEPIQTVNHNTPESAVERSSSLSMAFLLVLERLAPKERAAFLLREIFDHSYQDVAAVLGVQEAACRKLVSRARGRLGDSVLGTEVPRKRQEELLAAFQAAILTGATQQLAALMTEDIQLQTDGGGKALALPKPLFGQGDVLKFLGETLHRFWQRYRWQWVDLNGMHGALIFDDDQVVASVSLDVDSAERISGVYIMRNPDKLARLGNPLEPIR